MTIPALGVDISHYQQRPDFGALEAAGVRFVIIKATQGAHVDPDFERNRDEAVKRKLLWLPYAYLEPSDTATNFLRVVGAGVPAALDWEAPGVSAEHVGVWMDAVEDAAGRAGIAYYGIYPPAPATPRVARWPRWLPRYPARVETGPGLPGWDGASVVEDWSKTWMIWQYTGHGSLPGIKTEIDLNYLSCPWPAFRAWYDGAQPTVNPEVIPAAALPLRLHSYGPAVRALQAALGVTADGDFGPQTRGAVIAFQKTHALVVDGVVGLHTAAVLNKGDE